MKEIWKTMKENDKYEISSLGKVREKNTGKIRKIRVNNKGYVLWAFM